MSCQIFEIKNQEYSARINLSRGANCISLRNEKYGARILREAAGDGSVDNPYLYGMPILFPVNRISGGEFEFEGRTYRFPVNEPSTGCHLHGELHQMEFQLQEQKDNRIVCSYPAESEHLYLTFPHEFEIKVIYELTEEGLAHTTEVTNLSKENMPVFLGFHTTFNLPFCADSNPQDIRALVEIGEEYERNMTTYLPTGRKPAFDEVTQELNQGKFVPWEKPISRHYSSSRNGRMVLYDIAKDVSVVYENDVAFRFRLIYNGAKEGYICMEPQTCLANCQNSPFDRQEAGFDFVRPGETKTYRSKLYVASGDCR